MKTFILVLLLLGGCKVPFTTSEVLSQQTPGVATGAGATFTGPANSGGESTQTAEKRAVYYPAPVRMALPVYGQVTAQSVSSVQVPVETPVETPQPAWIDEKVTTVYAPHQDAAGIIKASNILGQWGKARWIGIICIVFSIGGLLWSHNNPDGYPLICWKIGACGVVLATLDPSIWWALLLLIPAIFYFAQKLGLLNIPGLPKI